MSKGIPGIKRTKSGAYGPPPSIQAIIDASKERKLERLASGEASEEFKRNEEEKNEVIAAHLAGVDKEEIAEQLGISLKTVKRYITAEHWRLEGIRRRAIAMGSQTVREVVYGHCVEAVLRGVQSQDEIAAGKLGARVLFGTGDLKGVNSMASGDTFNLMLVNADNEQLREALANTRAVLIEAGIDPESPEELQQNQRGTGSPRNNRENKAVPTLLAEKSHQNL